MKVKELSKNVINSFRESEDNQVCSEGCFQILEVLLPSES